MKSILITAVLLFSVFLQFTFAQEHKAIQRKGFVFGTSYGTGYSILKFPDKNQSELGFALDVKLGYMIKPDLALLLSSNVSIYDYSGFGRDRKRDFGILAPSVQYWVNDKFWVLGGVGLGGDNPVFWDIDFENVDTDPLETKYYNGLGFVTAVGYEIYQRKNMALDLKTKISYRNVEMQEGKTNGVSFTLLLGINFY
ncbi:MAG: hypothetical protein JXR36_11250 [Bacteroidales bacterium]|nr:hypothetical protein [Bacteroidales bacterium]